MSTVPVLKRETRVMRLAMGVLFVLAYLVRYH
jgi:hypothetical protein